MSRWRGIAFRVLSVLFALLWLNVAFSEAASGEGHTLHVVAFRYLFALLLLTMPALLQLFRAERKAAAMQLIVLAVTAHLMGTLIAPYLDPLAYGLVAIAVAMAWLHPARAEMFRTNFSLPLTILAAAGALPLLGFVIDQARLVRTDPSSHAVQGHWEDTAVFALALALAIILASLRTRGWWIPAAAASLATIAYGALSILEPDQASSWGRAWGGAAIAWAVGFVAALVLVSGRRSAPR
ncbi:MAG TPA: hypothetical protein VNO79_02310 [Actinomycetota bacterium]|nr:hypothetical protein [Actinomycetota bacterium]